MVSVNVDPKWLLEIVRLNRETHARKWVRVEGGYRVSCIVELKRMLEMAENGEPIIRSIRSEIHRPECHLDDYDTAIGMLERAEGDVCLESDDYDQLVLDKWHWSGSFSSSCSSYSSSNSSQSNSGKKNTE